MVIDGQSTTMTFDGEVVGGVITYTFSDADSREVAHRPLASDYTKWLPGQVSYGTVRLSCYRSDSDAGQAAILSSRDTRAVKQAVITLADGTVKSFPAYARSIPTTAGIEGVNTGTIVLRIAGRIV